MIQRAIGSLVVVVLGLFIAFSLMDDLVAASDRLYVEISQEFCDTSIGSTDVEPALRVIGSSYVRNSKVGLADWEKYGRTLVLDTFSGEFDGVVYEDQEYCRVQDGEPEDSDFQDLLGTYYTAYGGEIEVLQLDEGYAVISAPSGATNYLSFDVQALGLEVQDTSGPGDCLSPYNIELTSGDDEGIVFTWNSAGYTETTHTQEYFVADAEFSLANDHGSASLSGITEAASVTFPKALLDNQAIYINMRTVCPSENSAVRSLLITYFEPEFIMRGEESLSECAEVSNLNIISTDGGSMGRDFDLSWDDTINDSEVIGLSYTYSVTSTLDPNDAATEILTGGTTSDTSVSTILSKELAHDDLIYLHLVVNCNSSLYHSARLTSEFVYTVVPAQTAALTSTQAFYPHAFSFETHGESLTNCLRPDSFQIDYLSRNGLRFSWTDSPTRPPDLDEYYYQIRVPAVIVDTVPPDVLHQYSDTSTRIGVGRDLFITFSPVCDFFQGQGYRTSFELRTTDNLNREEITRNECGSPSGITLDEANASEISFSFAGSASPIEYYEYEVISIDGNGVLSNRVYAEGTSGLTNIDGINLSPTLNNDARYYISLNAVCDEASDSRSATILRRYQFSAAEGEISRSTSVLSSCTPTQEIELKPLGSDRNSVVFSFTGQGSPLGHNWTISTELYGAGEVLANGAVVAPFKDDISADLNRDIQHKEAIYIGVESFCSGSISSLVRSEAHTYDAGGLALNPNNTLLDTTGCAPVGLLQIDEVGSGELRFSSLESADAESYAYYIGDSAFQTSNALDSQTSITGAARFSSSYVFVDQDEFYLSVQASCAGDLVSDITSRQYRYSENLSLGGLSLHEWSGPNSVFAPQRNLIELLGLIIGLGFPLGAIVALALAVNLILGNLAGSLRYNLAFLILAIVIILIASELLNQFIVYLDVGFRAVDGDRFIIYASGLGRLGEVIASFWGVALLAGIAGFGLLVWRSHGDEIRAGMDSGGFTSI